MYYNYWYIIYSRTGVTDREVLLQKYTVSKNRR